MGEEIRGTSNPIVTRGCPLQCDSIPSQDAQAKYRESKAELDELVANMEGL